jgi:TPR repeat protein
MKALLAALLFAFCLLCPRAHAQQDDAKQKRFLEYKAKAEKGGTDAQYIAEKGGADAQYMLGFCYDNGEGVAKDSVEAVKWFRKAAERGHAFAQYKLGRCYYQGDGVAKDYAEAYAWWNLLSTRVKDAAEKRDILEKTMTPQQVAAAQKRTKELRAIVEAKAAK